MNNCKRIIHRSEHTVSRKNIDQDAVKVLYRLSRHGYAAHLVGGGVRDLLLGRTPKDFDISTNANPREIKKLFRNCMLIGKRFRLAHIRFGPKIIETSTFRRQPDTDVDPLDPEADLFHRSDNTFGTAEEDAWRRDFTINGLFYDIKNFSVIDYVGGLEDLENKLVRCIGDAETRFREDPVRMLRAVRFASRLGFSIEQKTMEAIVRHHEEITKAAPQRVLEEILRLFAFSSGEPAFRLLRQTGLLGDLFPEIDRYLRKHGGEEADLWRYLAALDELGRSSSESPPAALILGALLHDPLHKSMVEALRRDPNTPEPLLLHQFLEPFAVRFQIPKRILFRIIPMFMYQKRFDPDRRAKFSKAKFVKQESFAEALLLREIHLQVTEADLSILDPWKELVCETTEERQSRAYPLRADEGREGTAQRGPRPRSGQWRGRRGKRRDPGAKVE
jgi:poly(A) polymerase